MKLIALTDFTGIIYLDVNGLNSTYATDIMTELEKKLLLEILGDWLYNELDSALTFNETTQKYELKQPDYPELYKLVYGVYYFDLNGRYTVYEGLLGYLKYQIFYEYKILNHVHDTKIGTASYLAENGTVLPNQQNELYASLRYNVSLRWYYAIIRYILNNYQNLFTGEEGSNQYYHWQPPEKLEKNKIYSRVAK